MSYLPKALGIGRPIRIACVVRIDPPAHGHDANPLTLLAFRMGQRGLIRKPLHSFACSVIGIIGLFAGMADAIGVGTMLAYPAERK